MTRERNLETILTLVVALLVVFAITHLQWVLITAISLGALGILSTWLSSFISKGWLKLSEVLGFIVPKLILSALFFLVLFPLSVFYRITGADPLRLKRPKDSNYFVRTKPIAKSDFEKTW